MASLADRTIAALRAEHDTLTALVTGLSDEQLATQSGASEWTVAQVLSHIGSGAEIGLASLQAATGERDAPGDDFNPSVWDRWNAMSPTEQRDQMLDHDAGLVRAYEGLTPDQLESVQVSLGFLPFPLPLAAFAGLRLNEAAHHGWDAQVAFDPSADLTDDTAQLLAEHLAGGLGFLLGFATKPDALAEPATIAIADSSYRFVIGESVALTATAADPTATFTGGLPSAIRLTVGRLRPEFTAPDTGVTGNVTLDELRAVFPGY